MAAEPRHALQQGWFDDVPAAVLRPLGDGHINDTYLVDLGARSTASGSGQFVLQRLSERVFVDPAAVMSNVARVLEHCAGGEVPLAELITGRQGIAFWTDSDGSIWRLWRFRADTRVLSAPLAIDEVQQAGWAFGCLQRQLSSLPQPRLPPVIDGFLDLRHYLLAYDRALDGCDPAGCRSEMAFIAAMRDTLSGRFPPGADYIHGDCKLDNLLFAARSSELDCVIDLDTVMLGHWAWDFGDLARSIATMEGSVKPELLIAAARGFCTGKGLGTAADPAGSGAEIVEMLLEAPGYVTFMLAVRFLTDHLLGDQYFKVARAGDNLARARAQIARYENFAQHLPELRGRLSEALTQVALG